MKYPNAPYKIKSGGIEMVVYPATIWDEVKRLPDTIASAQDFFYASIHGSWTHVGTEFDSLWKVVAIDLARSIPSKVREKQQHCGRAFDKTIGPCPEWKEVELFSAIMRAIAQTNACTFVGDELGTSEHWIRSVERYPMAVMIACFALNAFPAFVRPVLSPLFFIPTMYVKWDAKRMLASVIKKNMEDYQNASDQKEYLRTKEDRQVPFTAWLMSRHKPGKATPHQLYVDILLASFESTASSASTLYNTVADLAAHPEYIEILREELQSVMVDGKLPMTNLNELKKMDSVMRESFRMTPFGLCTFILQARLFLGHKNNTNNHQSPSTASLALHSSSQSGPNSPPEQPSASTRITSTLLLPCGPLRLQPNGMACASTISDKNPPTQTAISS